MGLTNSKNKPLVKKLVRNVRQDVNQIIDDEEDRGDNDNPKSRFEKFIEYFKKNCSNIIAVITAGELILFK